MINPRVVVEKWLHKHAEWVYLDGISSMLHALVVLWAYLIPGLLIGSALNHISGLVAGIVIGGMVQYWYFMKEFGPKGDLKRVKLALYELKIGQKEAKEKIRDCYRDFGMTIISTVIAVGILYTRVKTG